MSEGEKEIMVHILAIEYCLAEVYRIDYEKWNKLLETIREKVKKECFKKDKDE